MRTRLRFDNEARYGLTERAVTAFGGYQTSAGWSVRVALGALLDGALDGNTPESIDLGVGPMAAISVARQWTPVPAWFVAGSASVSMTSSLAHEDTMQARFTAGDFRVGVIAGRTIAKTWQPYLLVRGFGGPVWWTVAGQHVLGTDIHHYQLGLGSSVATRFGLTAVVDVSLLGEQGASLGVSWRL